MTLVRRLQSHVLPSPRAPTGLQRDDVLGQDLRDLITTAVAQSPPQPSTAALPPPTASGASSQAGAGGSAHDGAQGLGPGPTTHHLLAVSPRPAPVAAAVPTPASAALRYAPIPWEQHQVLAAAREDVVLHNVVLPAAAAAGAGPGSTGGGFAPRGPLATLHFRCERGVTTLLLSFDASAVAVHHLGAYTSLHETSEPVVARLCPCT